MKHGFGLVTDARRKGKAPTLLYIFAEPAQFHGRAIAASAHEMHRAEIARFTATVTGDEVRFAACSWREWLATLATTAVSDLRAHATTMIKHFAP